MKFNCSTHPVRREQLSTSVSTDLFKITIIPAFACISLLSPPSVIAQTISDTTDSQTAILSKVGDICIGLNQLAGTPATVRPTPAQINANLTAPQQDLLRRCADVIESAGAGLPPNQGRATATDNEDAKVALNHIAPDEIAAQGTTSVKTVNAQQSNIAARVNALRSGLRGTNINQLSMVTGQGQLASNTSISQGGGGDDSSRKRLGYFLNGTLSSGDKETSGREAGFDFDNQNLTFGVDYFMDQSAFAGVAVAITGTDIDMANNGGNLNTDAIGLSLYGSVFKTGGAYLSGFFNYTTSSHDSERILNYTLTETDGGCCDVDETAGDVTVDQVASGETDGSQFTLAIDAGFDRNSNSWTYGPLVSLAYSKLTIDPFSESMSSDSAPGNGLGLEYEEQEIESLKSSIGFRFGHTSSKTWGILTKQVRIDWIHEFEDDNRLIQARYIHDPQNIPMDLETENIDTDFASIAVDLTAGFAGNRSAYISIGKLLDLDRIDYFGVQAGYRARF